MGCPRRRRSGDLDRLTGKPNRIRSASRLNLRRLRLHSGKFQGWELPYPGPAAPAENGESDGGSLSDSGRLIDGRFRRQPLGPAFGCPAGQLFGLIGLIERFAFAGDFLGFSHPQQKFLLFGQAGFSSKIIVMSPKVGLVRNLSFSPGLRASILFVISSLLIGSMGGSFLNERWDVIFAGPAQ